MQSQSTSKQKFITKLVLNVVETMPGTVNECALGSLLLRQHPGLVASVLLAGASWLTAVLDRDNWP